MLKEPLNFKNQTTQLVKHGVIIKDYDFAEKILYEIINSYPNVDLYKYGFTENYKYLLEK